MIIQTKYEIGQRVWIIYENRGEVCVYDDLIEEIGVDDNRIYYILENACIDISEKDIVLYDDTDELVEKIKETMQEIRTKESKWCNNVKRNKWEEVIFIINLRRIYANLYKTFDDLTNLIEEADEKICDKELRENDKYEILRKIEEIKYKLNLFKSRVKDIKILK